jgi:pyruvate/2-oxoglutarate dehydrogenase complex dihydrolipoamide acyltransferase (E2) component
MTWASGEDQEEVALSATRRAIGKRMCASLQLAPQVTTVVEVDVSGVVELRDKLRPAAERSLGSRLTVLPFFVVASCVALQKWPVVNAWLNDEGTVATYNRRVHMAVAVDTERGLIAPVIRDADGAGVLDVARRIAEMAERVRTARVGREDLVGGTFTISNTGSRGSLFDTPIINQPQVAILATGRVVRRPLAVFVEGEPERVEIRPMAYFSLSYDHRLIDGAVASQFLNELKDIVEHPAWATARGSINVALPAG